MKVYRFTDPILCDAQVRIRISIIHQMACKARLAELIEKKSERHGMSWGRRG